MIGRRFGIVALIPAMLNLTVASGGLTMAVRICTGDGQAHTLEVPLGGGDSGATTLCCAKGCHGSGQRKRLAARN